MGGWALGGDYRYNSGQVWTPFEDAGNGACNDPFSQHFFGVSACRPFAGTPLRQYSRRTVLDNAAAADCGLVRLSPAFGARRLNRDRRCIGSLMTMYRRSLFGTPYGNVPRNPGFRGMTVNTINLNLIKNNRVSEKVNLRLEANVYNLFNHHVPGSSREPISPPTERLSGLSLANDSGGVSARFRRGLR